MKIVIVDNKLFIYIVFVMHQVDVIEQNKLQRKNHNENIQVEKFYIHEYRMYPSFNGCIFL